MGHCAKNLDLGPLDTVAFLEQVNADRGGTDGRPIGKFEADRRNVLAGYGSGVRGGGRVALRWAATADEKTEYEG